MTTKPKTAAEGGRVVSLFRHAALEGVPEIPLGDVTDGREPEGAGFGASTAAPVDLALPPVWFLCGAGGSGKTVLARWLVWRMQQHGREAVLAALDPGNRSLARWFDDVQQPSSRDSAHSSRWLVQDLLDPLMEMDPRNPAVLDFGGGDVALAQAVEKTNGLHTVLESAGLGVVACYVLSPRIDDLGPLQTLERLGFQPPATLLVLNEGRADPTLPRSDPSPRSPRTASSARRLPEAPNRCGCRRWNRTSCRRSTPSGSTSAWRGTVGCRTAPGSRRSAGCAGAWSPAGSSAWSRRSCR